jgi:hypothetical protein
MMLKTMLTVNQAARHPCLFFGFSVSGLEGVWLCNKLLQIPISKRREF